jgi:hypothetical protein
MGVLLTYVAIASLGLPGLAGFWGEFTALWAAISPGAGPGRQLRGSTCPGRVRRDRHRADRRLLPVDAAAINLGRRPSLWADEPSRTS